MRSKFLFIPLLFSGLFGQWHQQAKINASDKASGENFGNSVSINGDYAIVGAKGDGGDSEGAAYIFIRSGTSWSQQAKITASDADGSEPDAYWGDCYCFAALDECGVCDGSGISDGACDCDGNVEDECG